MTNITPPPIKSIIIDDELANRHLLANMLQRHCPSVQIEGMAASADEGYDLIMGIHPQLVFLDVRMPESSGFDLLKRLKEINFNVIFISAYDQYAIDAFEFNALDYILKPIDHTRLVKAVNKAVNKIQDRNYSNIVHFVHSLDEKNELHKRMALHQNDKVHIVNINDICYLQAMAGYSEIVLISNHKYVSSKTLNEHESQLNKFNHFLRINKSMIININHVKNYTKGADCIITIGNNSEVEVSRRKRSSVIQYLRNMIS